MRLGEEVGWVYRMYDASGRLLYVGLTIRPVPRLKSHGTQSGWFADVHRITWRQHAAGHHLHEAEKRAIADEDPLHNVKRPGMPDRHHGPSASSSRRIVNQMRLREAER